MIKEPPLSIITSSSAVDLSTPVTVSPAPEAILNVELSSKSIFAAIASPEEIETVAPFVIKAILEDVGTP